MLPTVADLGAYPAMAPIRFGNRVRPPRPMTRGWPLERTVSSSSWTCASG